MRIKSWLLISALTAMLPLAPGAWHGLRAENAPPLPEFHFYSIGPESPPQNLRRDPVRLPASLGYLFKVDPPQGAIVNWTGSVTASGQTLTREVTPVEGGGAIFYRIDPCKVAGLDMPGTQIPVDIEFVFAVSGPSYFFNPPIVKDHFILTLTPDTVAPESYGYSYLPNDPHRDETVEITVGFMDASEDLGRDPVWDSGLREFRLEGQSSQGHAATQIYPVDETMPQTCNEKVMKAEHTFSYTIPHSAQPGDQIRLLAVATDWSGNEGEQEIILRVGGSEPDEEQRSAAPSDDHSFPPGSGCSDIRKTRYNYQGLNGKGRGWLHICGETLEVACPFSGFVTLAVSAEGPEVCCDDWQRARQSSQPCDVGQDADCDGTRNTEDNDPLRTGNPPSGAYHQ